VKEAFAGPDFEDEFAMLKQQVVDKELDIDSKKLQVINQGEIFCE
jgi:hypothetical protein